ncbi:MAG: metallophosphoesterase [Veillonellales bacterium]
MKFLFIGDIHIRGNNPRNRLDDYKEACKTKLRECFKIAVENKVTAILQSGDIFHSPEVSIATLLDFVEVFKECPVPIYCTVGNHDVFGYNLETYGRTSLQLLQLLVQNFNVAAGNARDTVIGDGKSKTDVWVSFQPYTSQVDTNGFGYMSSVGSFEPVIHMVHGMLLDHNLPYEAKYTNLYNVETDADIILSGHDHIGYGVIKRHDGKLFCNPGALMRINASTAEISRPIQVALINTEKMDIQLIPLKCAKPGEEVLDRSQIEENDARQYAMEEFSALIKTDTGTAVLNIPDIVEQIAKQEQLTKNVVDKAIELLGGVKSEKV